jgi:hypothetical protein
VPRCLTQQQRNNAFLDKEPPDWCIEEGRNGLTTLLRGEIGSVASVLVLILPFLYPINDIATATRRAAAGFPTYERHQRGTPDFWAREH